LFQPSQSGEIQLGQSILHYVEFFDGKKDQPAATQEQPSIRMALFT
jgi:hypothetical protein